jgi:hypothetical protein
MDRGACKGLAEALLRIAEAAGIYGVIENAHAACDAFTAYGRFE